MFVDYIIPFISVISVSPLYQILLFSRWWQRWRRWGSSGWIIIISVAPLSMPSSTTLIPLVSLPPLPSPSRFRSSLSMGMSRRRWWWCRMIGRGRTSSTMMLFLITIVYFYPPLQILPTTRSTSFTLLIAPTTKTMASYRLHYLLFSNDLGILCSSFSSVTDLTTYYLPKYLFSWVLFCAQTSKEF